MTIDAHDKDLNESYSMLRLAPRLSPERHSARSAEQSIFSAALRCDVQTCHNDVCQCVRRSHGSSHGCAATSGS